MLSIRTATYEDYMKATTAYGIITAYNEEKKLIFDSEVVYCTYDACIRNGKYVLTKNKKTILTAENRDDFIIKTLKTWKDGDYKIEDVYRTEAVKKYFLKQIAPNTAYWTFMKDMYKAFEKFGFDAEKTRKYLIQQINLIWNNGQVLNINWLYGLSDTLFLYTIEHFIRYAHDVNTSKFINNVDPLIDFIFGRNVSDVYEMVQSYTDMHDRISLNDLPEALSNLKASVSESVTLTGKPIHKDANAHTLMKLQIQQFVDSVFPKSVFWRYPNIIPWTSYVEKNKSFSVNFHDAFEGDDAQKMVCDLIDKLLSQTGLTYHDLRYAIPPRWTWNKDKTRIVDVGSRAAFDPSCFGPNSKERKEAGEAEKGLVLRPLPENYREECDFRTNAYICTNYVFNYPDVDTCSGNMARVAIRLIYQARDGFCTCRAYVDTHDYRERLDEKRTCQITKEVLENGLRPIFCKWEQPVKSYESGLTFFGERQDVKSDDLIIVDLGSLRKLSPEVDRLIPQDYPTDAVE